MITSCGEVVSDGEGGSGLFSAPLGYPLQCSRPGSRPGSQAGCSQEVESNTRRDVTWLFIDEHLAKRVIVQLGSQQLTGLR